MKTDDSYSISIFICHSVVPFLAFFYLTTNTKDANTTKTCQDNNEQKVLHALFSLGL